MTDFDARARDWDENPDRVARAKAVAAAIREQVTLSQATTVLEYGCGTGLLSFALQADLGPMPLRGTITLADSSSGMLEVLREKIVASGIKNMTPLKLDLAVDPLPMERFNLIYTLMTLHHIPEPAKVLQCFQSLLQPGGVLCIADLDKEDGSFHSHEPGFDGHNGFDRAELHLKLEQAGFTNIRLTTCFEMTKGERTYSLFLAVAENYLAHETN